MATPLPLILPEAPAPAADAGADDAAWVQAALAGDMTAFARLVKAHQEAQFRTALRLVGDRDEAHEALQSAFVRAHRHLAQCDDPTRFGGWMARIVVNECRTLVARRAKRDRRFVRDETVLASAVAPTSGVLADAPGAGLFGWREEIERALAQLPHEQREAFVLKYVNDYGYDEMATLTGVGVSALKMRVKRACERLRTLLQDVSHD
jgi:RNA polymerase sigma-70 factor, ECF subfamily